MRGEAPWERRRRRTEGWLHAAARWRGVRFRGGREGREAREGARARRGGRTGAFPDSQA